MEKAFLIQLAGSLAAVAALVGLAAWARISRAVDPLTPEAAEGLLAEEFPGRPFDQLWIARDGASALARSGDKALAVVRLGDGFVARAVAWNDLAQDEGDIVLRLPETAAPRLRLAIAWPLGAPA